MMRKLKTVCLFTIVFCFSFISYSQTIPDSMLYLGQTTPGDSVIIFAPGIISSPGRTENRITFSPDQKMCFFSAMGGPVLFMEYKNDGWTTPVTQNSKFKSEPFFSLDGTKIYLNSRAALNQVGGCDLSYSERQDSLWIDPVSLGNPPNTPGEQYHPCIAADSSIYFSDGDGNICRSQFMNGVYQQRVVLPYPVNYANISQTWGDPYVAPDESFLIFRSTRSGGYGGSDIYISYKKPDGSWTNPKNLGNKINTTGDELSGDITPDGKYMTFGRNSDLYWVSADFINDLQNTNFFPYVKNSIPNQTVAKDSLFSYQIPESTFIDDDGYNTLRYSITLSNGNPLPAWLSMDTVTYTLSGIPDEAALYSIKVTATDTAGAGVSCTFKITVTETPSGVEKEKGRLLQEFALDQNYPNPFNPATTIKFSIAKSGMYSLRVFNVLGQEVKQLINGELAVGFHKVSFNGSELSSGIYTYKLTGDNVSLTKKMLLVK